MSADVDRRDPDGAERRTSLAGERTLLAWWRTALTAIAVALGVGRLIPELATGATHWPYAVLGVGFALYGIAMFLLGTRRMGVFDRTAWRSAEHSAEDWMLVGFMGAGTVLGVGTLALIVVQ